MLLTSIAPWFGSKRTLAPEVVRQLGRHSYYLEGCCGSMAVLLAKEPASHELAVDLHGLLTNLAWVVQREDLAAELFDRCRRTLYSDELYRASCDWLAAHGADLGAGPSPDHAYHYFVASWMGRNGLAGTALVNYQIATRWTKGGGSGPLRFRNATESIPAWCDRLRDVHVMRRDLFLVLPKVEDDGGAAVYVDPPYLPETVNGSATYLHGFDGRQHRRLAEELRRFRRARVVVSYYDSPLLAELYPGWTRIDCSRHKHLHVQTRRGSERAEAPEVLLVNGPAFWSPADPAAAEPAERGELF